MLNVLEPDQLYLNYSKGQIQQDPPPFKPYVLSEVIANKIVMQIVERMLGIGNWIIEMDRFN